MGPLGTWFKDGLGERSLDLAARSRLLEPRHFWSWKWWDPSATGNPKVLKFRPSSQPVGSVWRDGWVSMVSFRPCFLGNGEEVRMLFKQKV